MRASTSSKAAGPRSKSMRRQPSVASSRKPSPQVVSSNAFKEIYKKTSMPHIAALNSSSELLTKEPWLEVLGNLQTQFHILSFRSVIRHIVDFREVSASIVCVYATRPIKMSTNQKDPLRDQKVLDMIRMYDTIHVSFITKCSNPFALSFECITNSRLGVRCRQPVNIATHSYCPICFSPLCDKCHTLFSETEYLSPCCGASVFVRQLLLQDEDLLVSLASSFNAHFPSSNFRSAPGSRHGLDRMYKARNFSKGDKDLFLNRVYEKFIPPGEPMHAFRIHLKNGRSLYEDTKIYENFFSSKNISHLVSLVEKNYQFGGALECLTAVLSFVHWIMATFGYSIITNYFFYSHHHSANPVAILFSGSREVSSASRKEEEEDDENAAKDLLNELELELLEDAFVHALRESGHICTLMDEQVDLSKMPSQLLVGTGVCSICNDVIVVGYSSISYCIECDKVMCLQCASSNLCKTYTQSEDHTNNHMEVMSSYQDTPLIFPLYKKMYKKYVMQQRKLAFVVRFIGKMLLVRKRLLDTSRPNECCTTDTISILSTSVSPKAYLKESYYDQKNMTGVPEKSDGNECYITDTISIVSTSVSPKAYLKESYHDQKNMTGVLKKSDGNKKRTGNFKHQEYDSSKQEHHKKLPPLASKEEIEGLKKDIHSIIRFLKSKGFEIVRDKSHTVMKRLPYKTIVIPKTPTQNRHLFPSLKKQLRESLCVNKK